MSLLQDLKASGFWKGRAVVPTTDKISRMAGVTAMIEEGRVYLPHHAAWLDDYLQELCSFPGTKYDDQVDSTSQVLAWRWGIQAGCGITCGDSMQRMSPIARTAPCSYARRAA